MGAKPAVGDRHFQEFAPGVAEDAALIVDFNARALTPFATFSNYGATVTVIAPGVNILSDAPGGGYAVKSGTSMATPHVAGLLAYFSGSTITTPGPPHRPSGRELVALLLRNRGGELIPGRFDARSYPLLFRR